MDIPGSDFHLLLIFKQNCEKKWVYNSVTIPTDVRISRIKRTVMTKTCHSDHSITNKPFPFESGHWGSMTNGDCLFYA